MNKNRISSQPSQRRSNKEIVKAIRKNGGPFRMHADPELHTANTPHGSAGDAANDVLKRLDATGVSSERQRRRGSTAIKGAVVAGLLAISPVGETVGGILQDTGDRIEANFDNHNLPPGGKPIERRTLPPGGKPIERRTGDSYEPGTDNTVATPTVVAKP